MAAIVNYSCKYINKVGEVEVKDFEAENEAQVQAMIREIGATPINIAEKVESVGNKPIGKNGFFAKKVKASDLSLFCRQQYTMLHAGMPLVKSLEVMEEQLEHPVLKEAAGDMMDAVRKGNMFSDAMKHHPKVFPDLLVSMVETGEMTGRQDDVLEKMSVHYNKEDKIEKKIKGAMIYPKFLSVLTLTVVVIMLTKILPQFVVMFEGSDVEMPWLTQAVMDLSDFIVANWFWIIIVAVALVFAWKAFYKSERGRHIYDAALFKIPLISGSMRKIVTSRFTRTLSTLLSSGLPLLQSLQMAGKVTNNVVVEEKISDLTDDIKKGSSLSQLISQIEVFPPMLVSMISIGEESGALEDMLEKTSDFYDDELEAAMDKLVRLLEPGMILVMGIIIGVIVIAMLLPMFDIIQTVQ